MALRSEQEWLSALGEAGFREAKAQRLLAQDPEAEAWKREQGTLLLMATA